MGTIAEERSDNAALRSKLESLEAHTSRQAEKRGVEMDRLLSQVLLCRHRPLELAADLLTCTAPYVATQINEWGVGS